MKKTFLIAAITLFSLGGCNQYLDRQPLDTPSLATYFNNEAEMNLALTGVYNASYWVTGNVPAQVFFDLYTDIGLERQPGLASGNFDATNLAIGTYWQQMYQTVTRANVVIAGMERGKAAVAPATFNRIQAEAKILRAWAYYHLIGLYGDVPFYTDPLTTEQFYTLGKTDRNKIADYLLTDLDDAAGKIDWASRERGRVNRGVAIGTQAKLALLLGRYQVAADAAKKVIDSNVYGLNPNFAALFTLAGQQANANREIMFEFLLPTDQANPVSYIALGQGSRTLSGQSGRFPLQALVDKFEAIDGKRIDESKVYDPAKPREKRDPRLKFTVSMDGDTITATASSVRRRAVFNIYDATTPIFNFTNNTYAPGTNVDLTNAFGPVKNGMGLLWSKYTLDDAQDMFISKTGFAYLRYADILLTYAEAKIELNQIDASVTTAMNAVRKRAGMPNVAPELVASQAKMRQLVRREKVVELANEGVHLFDMRRWGTGKLGLNTFVYGAPLARAKPAPIPAFGAAGSERDLNDIPDYTNGDALRFKREQRTFIDRNNLFPIPQRELDINKVLTQNQGW
ncbi:RagB/SusD family nutrient uptake outer membrane protein [Fibrella aquatilis]|uniref:RagB/SusD family nutrient uptake outer membrane protein n=1 Tax=Fibrella aquatilis TaxID=2817059 RepID=A0A939G2P0_9BACT|nr:RagB/SusD family nutrient uptake outer membrane protein [Fibrella aquatilis]MBO0930073.1 RagB/SusD family nutrient uptake outer membrane protein [Fibrella aquatilis]